MRSAGQNCSLNCSGGGGYHVLRVVLNGRKKRLLSLWKDISGGALTTFILAGKAIAVTITSINLQVCARVYGCEGVDAGFAKEAGDYRNSRRSYTHDFCSSLSCDG